MTGTLAGATLLTMAAEAVVLLAVLRVAPGAALAVSAAVNLITVPLANLAFQAAVARGVPVAFAFFGTEAAVVAAEAPLLAGLLGRSWRSSLQLSVAANLCSMALSVAFW